MSLELLTVGWNTIEGIVAVSAATAAGSVALLGFGIDSFVETMSGAVLIWRLRAERRGIAPEKLERLDSRARKLVAASLFGLAAWVTFDAASTLWTHDKPSPTLVGVVVTAVSLAVMMFLARAKRRVARHLGSRAMEADAFQTTACWWLSLTTLIGIGLNAVLGWWWADPAAAMVVAALIVKEGRDAWSGEDCC